MVHFVPESYNTKKITSPHILRWPQIFNIIIIRDWMMLEKSLRIFQIVRYGLQHGPEYVV